MDIQILIQRNGVVVDTIELNEDMEFPYDSGTGFARLPDWLSQQIATYLTETSDE